MQPSPSAQSANTLIFLIQSPILPFYDTKTGYKVQGLRLGENVEVFHQTSVIHDHTAQALHTTAQYTHIPSVPQSTILSVIPRTNRSTDISSTKDCGSKTNISIHPTTILSFIPHFNHSIYNPPSEFTIDLNWHVVCVHGSYGSQ